MSHIGFDDIEHNGDRANCYVCLRAAIIEECAVVAEKFTGTFMPSHPQNVAAAIRALKTK